MIDQVTRDAIVAEARTWIGTRFHDNAGIKGVGVDCMWLVLRIYQAVGLVPDVKVPDYSPQFPQHRDDEPFLREIEPWVEEFAGPPLEGDIVIWKFGRAFAHSAIVVKWPRIIHAHKPAGTTLEDDALRNRALMRRGQDFREHKFFRLRERE